MRVLLLAVVAALLVSQAVAFTPGGFGGGQPANNQTHSPDWYAEQEEENNQEVCMASENHVVDKEGVCSCDEGWTGYPSCNLLGPIDNCVSQRTENGTTHTSCAVLYPFLCSEKLAVSWVLTISGEEGDSASETLFSGVVSLDPKFDTQSVCAKSKVDLSTFSVQQELDVEYCLYLTDVQVVGTQVFANVTFQMEQLMSRVPVADSSITFGVITVDGVPCGDEAYIALPCDYEPPASTFAASPGVGTEPRVFVGANSSCVYVRTARVVYPLCCAAAVMYNCAEEASALAVCAEGLGLTVALVEPETGEDTVQESCGNVGDLEVCLGVTDYRIDADKDSHRGVAGVYRARVTLPDGNATEYDLGAFEETFPMCGHDCSYDPGVNKWVALAWVIGMNILTVGGFLLIVAVAYFGYKQLQKGKSSSPPEDLSMVSLLDESVGEDGVELDLVGDDEDDLLG